MRFCRFWLTAADFAFSFLLSPGLGPGFDLYGPFARLLPFSAPPGLVGAMAGLQMPEQGVLARILLNQSIL